MGRMLVVGLIALVAGCSYDDVTMYLEPASMDLLPGAIGDVWAYHVVDGEEFRAVEAILWTSSDPAIVEVYNGSSIGSVTALEPGSVTIRAESLSDAIDATMTIRVEDAEVTAIELSTTEVTMAVGGSVYVYVTATYGGSEMLDVTTTATWTSDMPDVAQASDGWVSGVAPGTAIVTVEFRGASVSLPVTVTDG